MIRRSASRFFPGTLFPKTRRAASAALGLCFRQLPAYADGRAAPSGRRLWRSSLPLLAVLACTLVTEPAFPQTPTCTTSDTAVSAVSGSASLAGDCTTLLAMKSTLEGTGSLNWDVNTSMATWDGVLLEVTIGATVVNAGQVHGIVFHSRDGVTINGTLPAGLNNLTGLRLMTFETKELTGGIPDLTGLVNLDSFNVQEASLSGTVDATRFPPSLTDLRLGDNDLSGTLPDVTRFPGLEGLFLGENGFSGGIPANWNTLTDLTSIDVGNNDLTGALPDWSALVKLNRLEAHHNNLSGAIPAWLNNMTRLQTLWLHNNEFTGGLPDLSALTNPATIAVSDNKLTGTIPASHLPRRSERLYLMRNQFTGSIPDFSGQNDLRLAWLHQNQFSGALPTSWTGLTKLDDLHVANNPLTGAIPSGLGDLTGLENISLCNTDLDSGGSLPSALETRRTDGNLTVYSCVSTADASATEGSPVTFTVTQDTYPLPGTAGGTGGATLEYETADGTATSGEDYTGTSEGSVTIPANTDTSTTTSSATFEVATISDSTPESVETFSIALTSSTSGVIVFNPRRTGSIVDLLEPPRVSVHPADAIGIEGGDAATVELRLSRALESGESLTVGYSLDMDATAQESHDGVTLTHTAGATSTGTVGITGPDAPRRVHIRLNPAANTVDRRSSGDRRGSGSRAADFLVTGVSGVDGASLSGLTSAKIFVNDSQLERYTAIQVSGGAPLGRRQFEEGVEVRILLDGRAGKKRNPKPHPYDRYNVVIGVQNLTTSFDDLDRARPGHDTIGGFQRRDEDKGIDYYNVGVLGSGRSGELVIPIRSDGASEGDERFRVFIAETPGNISNPTVVPNNGVRTSYMGVRGAYNSLSAAPGVDFTIKGQSGGGQRDEPPRPEPPRPEPPPTPTQAVSNVRVTAVDAANARVTWDAVEHATSYDVEYETTSALADPSNSVQGAAFGWTGTSWTFRHDAAEAMTITVTVTPAYEDGNGDTLPLDNLAGSATIDVAPTRPGDSTRDGDTPPGDDDAPPPTCVKDAQWKTVVNYYEANSGRAPNYGANWYRVLIAYQKERTDKELPDWVGATAKPTTPYTAKEAKQSETVWSGWTPVRKVLKCLEGEKAVGSQSFVPLLPAGWDPKREGVLRFLNRSAEAAAVRILATDDSGWSPPAATLHVAPGESVHLVTRDLEEGNVAKGLMGYIGTGSGNWRLDTSSEQDVEVRAFVRSRDGLLAPMDDIAEASEDVHHVPTLHPADSRDRGIGLLRLVNRGDEPLTARIVGTDDSGAPGGEVTLDVPARESVLLSAAELEGGGADLRGAFGDGQGMWRLRIASEGDLATMSLLESPDGYLANLSRGGLPALRSPGAHAVPYFPSTSDALRQGLIRLANQSAVDTTVRIEPRDDTERRFEPLTLTLGPGEAAHLDSRDLELGNESRGLRGSTGPGTGDWRLDISSEPGVLVLPYVRTREGSLVPLHHLVGEADRSRRAR